jgi:hypothetical protein
MLGLKLGHYQPAQKLAQNLCNKTKINVTPRFSTDEQNKLQPGMLQSRFGGTAENSPVTFPSPGVPLDGVGLGLSPD